MRIEQSYPSPIHGVSTLAPRTRPQGYATQQINFRSDPVNKLTRRPSSIFKGKVDTTDNPDSIQYHSYERGGQEYSFVVDTVTGNVKCYVDDVLEDTINLGAYTGDNIGLFTIDHDTYVVNRDVVVAKSTDTDEASGNFEKVSHINVTTALNYNETVQVNVIKSNGDKHIVSYKVPNLGVTDPDYDAADKARATKQVALELANRINGGGTHSADIPNPDYAPVASVCYNEYIYTYDSENDCYDQSVNGAYNPTASICKPFINPYSGIPGVTAVALGSSVAVWEDGRADWLQVEVEAGQGDRTTVAANEVIEDTDGLPLFAVAGTRVTVRPDPTSEKGVYYLQAERTASTASGEYMEEVVWSENRNPTEQHSLDSATMPHVIQYDGTNFAFGEIAFKSRLSGDDESVPFPDFVGKTIQSLGYFQKRLSLASENGVYMTETDDLLNWFKQSAVQLLVSDTVAVTTSELGADKILHLIPHNRDLLCITSNSQFKISGSAAVTPQTVSMTLTTKYECQVSVPPVSIGNSVYFPIDYGDSTGLHEYTGERDTSQDVASPITNHVVGYMPGKAKLLAASPNLEMLAMTTEDSDDNVLYIYEQYTTSEGKRSQRSWSTWELSGDEKIVDIKFRRNELVLLTVAGNTILLKSIQMYTRITTSPLEVYLDNLLDLQTDGLTVTIPDGYDTTDCIAVRGDGTQSELWKVGFTQDGLVLTFEEDIDAGRVYLGKTFTSTYEPARPFKYDEDGSTITTDSIRVSKFILSLVDTHELSMTKLSRFVEDVTVTFESRFLDQYRLGTIDSYTGDWKFSFSEKASLATPLFFTDSYLGCTIADISWEGQYLQTKQRMK
jgi:hypothetical protein